MFGQHMMPPAGVFVKAVEPPTVVSESVAPPARPPDFGAFYFHFVVLLVLLRAFTSCLERKPGSAAPAGPTYSYSHSHPMLIQTHQLAPVSFVWTVAGHWRMQRDTGRHGETRGEHDAVLSG